MHDYVGKMCLSGRSSEEMLFPEILSSRHPRSSLAVLALRCKGTRPNSVAENARVDSCCAAKRGRALTRPQSLLVLRNRARWCAESKGKAKEKQALIFRFSPSQDAT